MAPRILTSALDGGEWSALRAGCFNRGEMSRNSLDRRLGGPHSRSGRPDEKKIPSLPMQGIEPQSSSS
jgi:hypothetical protein